MTWIPRRPQLSQMICTITDRTRFRDDISRGRTRLRSLGLASSYEELVYFPALPMERGPDLLCFSLVLICAVEPVLIVRSRVPGHLGDDIVEQLEDDATSGLIVDVISNWLFRTGYECVRNLASLIQRGGSTYEGVRNFGCVVSKAVDKMKLSKNSSQPLKGLLHHHNGYTRWKSQTEIPSQIPI